MLYNRDTGFSTMLHLKVKYFISSPEPRFALINLIILNKSMNKNNQVKIMVQTISDFPTVGIPTPATPVEHPCVAIFSSVVLLLSYGLVIINFPLINLHLKPCT